MQKSDIITGQYVQISQTPAGIGERMAAQLIDWLLLAAVLQMKAIKVEWVKGMSDFLISNMGFFFVPPGVALMLYLDVIKAEFVPIVVATVVSTVLVLIVTGWTHQGFKRLKN